MALGIKSIAAIVGLSVAGIGAVSGIGYGIHVATTSQYIKTNEIENTSKPNDLSKENPTLNDSPQTPSLNLQKYQTFISASDIFFKELDESNNVKENTKLSNSKTYAYSISNKQIGFVKDTKKIPNEINVAISIDEQKNNFETNNKGVLVLKVSLSNSIEKEQAQAYSFNLEISDFKKVNEKLLKLLSKEDEDKFILDLSTQKEPETITALRIEDLNKENDSVTLPKKVLESRDTQTKKATALTDLFWKTDFKDKQESDLYLGDYSIVGEVKLEQIKESNGQINYYLVSANKNDHLKVVKDTQTKEEKEELLVSKIKLNDLVPSSLDINLISEKDKTNKKLIEEIKSDDQNHKNYFSKKTDDNNKIDLLDLWINLNADDKQPINRLNLKAYSLTESDLKEKGKLPISIVIKFGSGIDAKTYSNNKDEALLKAMGYSFGIYSKKLDETSEVISGDKLKDTKHALDKFFGEEKRNKFIEAEKIKNPPQDNKTTENGSYYFEAFDKDHLKDIQVDLQNSVGEKDLADIKTKLPANFLFFVSYTNTKHEQSSKNMVNYLPHVVLVHVAKVNEGTK